MSKKIVINYNEHEFNEIRDLRSVFKENNITVSEHVEIGNNCYFEYGVTLETASKIGDNVKLHENVRVGADAKVEDHCEIFENTVIQSCAKIGKYSRIGANNIIGEEAKVNAHTNLLHSIFIQGTMHPVTYVGNEKISIGCVCEKIDKWKMEISEIGKKHRYSVQAIKEYIGYIEQIEKFLESNNDRFDF